MLTLEGERTLLEAENQLLVITTHRVRRTWQMGGGTQVTSIMIDEVSGCEITHSSNRILVLLAILSFLATLIMNGQEHDGGAPVSLIVGLTFTAVFGAAYYLTRKQIVQIASSSAKIKIVLEGMSLEKAVAVIDTVEAAKNERDWLRKSAAQAPQPVATSGLPAWSAAPQT
jgi:hypothetical protein